MGLAAATLVVGASAGSEASADTTDEFITAEPKTEAALPEPEQVSIPADVDPNISDAVRPLADLAGWADIKTKFKNTYASYLRQTQLQSASKPDNNPVLAKKTDLKLSFRANQFDLLLDQSAALVDRAATARDRMQDRAAQAATLGSEIEEFVASDQIHADEVSAGIYATPYVVSHNEWRSTQLRGSGLDEFVDRSGDLMRAYFDFKKMKESSAASQLLAWLAAPPEKPTKYTWSGRKDGAGILSRDAAATLAYRREEIEYFGRTADLVLQKHLKAAALSAERAAFAKKNWDEKDVAFKRRRTEAARAVAAHKVRMATDEGGALNYAEQAVALQARILRDLIDAAKRVSVAAEGLRLFCGYKEPLPEGVMDLMAGNRIADTSDTLERITGWVRNAATFLQRFVQADLSSVATFSVKQLIDNPSSSFGKLNPKNFVAGMNKQTPGGRRYGAWTILLDKKHFQNMSNVRLRGVNVYACTEGKYRDTLWSGRVEMPSNYEYFGQQTFSYLPQQPSAIHIGRIFSRSKVSHPEIFGANSHRNLNPIGSWTVVIEAGVLDGVLVSETVLQDVHLDVEYVAHDAAG